MPANVFANVLMIDAVFAGKPAPAREIPILAVIPYP